MRRNRTWTWKPAFAFLALWLGFSVPLSRAQSTDQVWSQLQSSFATARDEGYKQYNYVIGYLDNGMEPTVNWPVEMSAGSSYLIVGVCDNDCTDVDLSLEDTDRNVVASDVLNDDIPMVEFTPKADATYWIRPTMAACSVNPCGYGIAVFIQ
ncbi:MAG TPA: hypothetical protein VIE68_12345 [Gemmatimonadota bacterium]